VVRNGGFSLIELLVTTAIMGVVTVYLLDTVTTQHKSYTVIDQVVEVQQSGRLITELIERDVRHAGFMVPEGAAVCGIDNINTADVLYLSDADAIVSGTQTRPDLGAIIQGGPANISVGTQLIDVDSVVLEKGATANPFYDSDGNGVPDADFNTNAGVIIVDAGNPERGSACGVVDSVTSATRLRITLDSTPLGPIPVPSNPVILIAVPAHHYRVDINGQLFRDNIIVSDGVEDLQVAFFFDDNQDNVIDPGEYRGDGLGPDYVNNAVNASDIRELRTNVILRTRLSDTSSREGQFQVTENRLFVAGNDGFRRRVYTATTMLRNVGARDML